MQDAANVLNIQDLHIHIKLEEGLLTPVRGVSFGLRAGETLGLVGESGCGKSLTCKAILGINSKNCRTGGQITFCDEDGIARDLLTMPFGGKDIRQIRGRRIAMIYQEPMTAFSPLFTVGHQLAEGLLVHTRMSRHQARERVLLAMDRVGIADANRRFDQHPHEFSGGMLQRALIAMSLLNSPRLLIADEPTTALDVTIQAQILELLKQLQVEFGMAILYVTHDLGTVAQVCDRVAVMYLGRIIEMGPVHDIYSRPAHPYTRGLIGSVHKIGGGKGRLYAIDGSVPLAMNLQDRCAFYDRCDHRDDVMCPGREPGLMQVGEGHFAACWRPLDAHMGGGEGVG